MVSSIAFIRTRLKLPYTSSRSKTHCLQMPSMNQSYDTQFNPFFHPHFSTQSPSFLRKPTSSHWAYTFPLNYGDTDTSLANSSQKPLIEFSSAVVTRSANSGWSGANRGARGKRMIIRLTTSPRKAAGVLEECCKRGTLPSRPNPLCHVLQCLNGIPYEL